MNGNGGGENLTDEDGVTIDMTHFCSLLSGA